MLNTNEEPKCTVCDFPVEEHYLAELNICAREKFNLEKRRFPILNLKDLKELLEKLNLPYEVYKREDNEMYLFVVQIGTSRLEIFGSRGVVEVLLARDFKINQ